MKTYILTLCLLGLSISLCAQTSSTDRDQSSLNEYFKPLKWRSIGPFRGGRSVASCGLNNDPLTYYMGTTGGGLWKTTDAGQHWNNISDGFFKTGSVGAVAVADADPNLVYVGMGEHAVRGVMTSYGDGVYKSTDAGKSWAKMGLDKTRHIAGLAIHPSNPNVVYVAAQGALHGPSQERGVYRSTDGGSTWEKILYVNDKTGCAHLVMDKNNPRILYAAMWEHQRLPWKVVSGGEGSGLYKSTDGGDNWEKIETGLPDELGKMSIALSQSNPDKVYALVESDTEKEQGGLFVSSNAGKSWTRISKDHRLVQRAWYYIEVFVDPQDEHTVYALNAAALKSIDGGKTWSRLSGTHGDYHDLWINPKNSNNMVISNDGGAAISFNGGDTWSTQSNMPTAQFYRVNVDNKFPYQIYGGQQDNSSVVIQSSGLPDRGINQKNWTYSAGGESAFLAFDPDNPRYVLGGSYQGAIECLDTELGDGNRIMATPHQYLAREAKDMAYRFNWNAPIIWSQHEPNTYYHAGNVVLKTQDRGLSWTAVSPDLSRNEKEKQGKGGGPYTNEGAGGENYGTISYLAESPHEAGVIWAGSDDGLVHITQDGGKNWQNVTPRGLAECLINAIEVSPYDAGTAYIATTRYKFNDFRPGLYKTTDYGNTWTKIDQGIPDGAYTRVVREDPKRKNLLFAGTETGLYISWDGGSNWSPLQLNLPIVPITDLIIKHGNLVAATQGRSFWVLDDLWLLRNYEAKTTSSITLYAPAQIIRQSGSSEMDGNRANFTGSNTLRGVNPATGMAIYYHLPEAEKSSIVSIEIKDQAGQLVRKFTSEKDADFESYPGGPRPDPVLSKKSGLNNFVWDMRHSTLLGAPKAYLEGSYRGHRVKPGSYSLHLEMGGQKIARKFEVLPHPKVEADAQVYQVQDQLMKRLASTINDIHGKVTELQDIKAQIQSLNKRLTKQDIHPEEVEKAKAIIAKIDAWDAELIQRKSQSYDDVINFPNKLSAEYLFLKGQLDNNIPEVTQAMQERFTELEKTWDGLKRDYQTLLQDDIIPFSQNLQKAGISIIQMKVGRP